MMTAAPGLFSPDGTRVSSLGSEPAEPRGARVGHG